MTEAAETYRGEATGEDLHVTKQRTRRRRRADRQHLSPASVARTLPGRWRLRVRVHTILYTADGRLTYMYAGQFALQQQQQRWRCMRIARLACLYSCSGTSLFVLSWRPRNSQVCLARIARNGTSTELNAQVVRKRRFGKWIKVNRDRSTTLSNSNFNASSHVICICFRMRLLIDHSKVVTNTLWKVLSLRISTDFWQYFTLAS